MVFPGGHLQPSYFNRDDGGNKTQTNPEDTNPTKIIKNIINLKLLFDFEIFYVGLPFVQKQFFV